ncbi:MAG: hypothetical protein DMF19_06550 [Verrucomicrobia bacterium]|nr:MAG: hypothetical protein DMF19_06550 [Verrucomicrobiota bacterium]
MLFSDPGSARAARAGDGALAIANFSRPRALRRGAAMSTRGACAPQTNCVLLSKPEFGNGKIAANAITNNSRGGALLISAFPN